MDMEHAILMPTETRTGGHLAKKLEWFSIDVQDMMSEFLDK